MYSTSDIEGTDVGGLRQQKILGRECGCASLEVTDEVQGRHDRIKK